MPDDDPAEGPEGESDDSDDRSQEETTESTGGDLSPEAPGDSVDPDDSDAGSEEATAPEEFPEDRSEEEPDEEELSPEELAEEVLEDVDTGGEEASSEPDAEEADGESEESEDVEADVPDTEPQEEPTAEEPADEPTEEEEEAPEEEPSPEELAEEVLEDEPGESSGGEDREDTSDPEESPGEESSTEEIVDDVLQEEASDEDVSPEDLAEEVLSEEEEGSPEETGTLPDEDRPKSETTDETTASEEESGFEEESESPEEAQTDEGETKSDEEASIQDMLEQEAEKAREVEEEGEEEDELPEGYLTVEQLPEEEEFEVPQWVKRSGWFLLYGVIGLLVGWYLLLPLWETFLLNQVKASMDQNQPEDARSWVNWGTGSGALLIKNDDAFRADYLQQLLDAEALGRFTDEHERLNNFDPSPYMNQAFTQYLINQGEWSRAMNQAENLQQWVRTRGPGYLLHGKAVLEQGRYEQVEADASRATPWLGNHPGTKRLLRDLRFHQGDFETSLQLSNELQGLVEKNVHWSMKVRDYLQLARINKELDRHRVAQRMLERALDLDPRNKGVMKDLGTQYLLEGRQKRAEPMINGIGGRPGYRKLYPLNAFGWWGGAELAQSEDRPPRSIRFIERAEDLAPRNAEVHRVKGELYSETLDRPDQAVPEFKRARELGIDRLRLVNSLAQAQYGAGQYEGAVEVYTTLREHVSDIRPDIIYNLGSSYLGAGEFERAEDLIRRAHNQGYRNQNSFNQWGLALEMQGERQRALAKYVEGIEWGERNNEPIGRVRKNLNRALAQDSPSPPTDWLAPVETDLEFAPWATLDQSSNGGTRPSR